MKKISLLAEDEQNDVLFMQAALKKAGMDRMLRLVTDGQQALDYMKGAGEFGDRRKFPLPCIVLLDLKLPRVMGMEVLRWIRQEPAFTTIIVIVLTSSSQEADMEKAYRLGANAYLVKPSNPKKLHELVSLIGRFWLNLNQPTSEAAGSADIAKRNRGIIMLRSTTTPAC